MASVFVRAEDVAEAIVARLEGISVANGFETDIGAKLYRGMRRIPSDEEIGNTGVVFLIEGNDSPQEQQSDRGSLVQNVQGYEVWGFGPCDPEQPNAAAHKMIRDIKKALWGGEFRLGGKVRNLTYRGRDIGPRPDGAAFVQAAVAFSAEYVESLASP